ncbi:MULTISPECIES: serine/threonine protein kinase [unclassified Solwaraspora]|uniref:serine/threonine protein kinase n=1 Tax=unclassified Solwaraspora TaxID=2627926 RepID=UPI00259B5F17|nr:serine/threonine protein kinase [Solwaraspora sp. WMMA2056]WJK38493.1 protein kinase [Solwaraspora sp. WMMA2056]
MVFAPGLRLDRRYVLADLIGLGGMSQVWRADDELLDRTVAVKALTPPVAPAVRAACRQEARAAARITHPHVTQVYDYGEACLAGDEVVPYLVLELVDGENLAARLADGPLPWPAAGWLAAQVASGLAAAHRIGVVHRDVKPGNVMLTATGAKILDFGIAAVVDGAPAPDGPPAPEAGWLLGTPTYAAPELLGHGPAHPAADVYALGVLYYEMLTGSPPSPARSWSEAAQQLRRAADPVRPAAPGLPPAAADLCLACLRRDPAARPSAAEAAAALHALLGVQVDLPIPAPSGRAARPGVVDGAPRRGDRTLVERTPATGVAGPARVAAARPPRAVSARSPVVEADPGPAGTADGPGRRPALAMVGLAGAGAAALMAATVVAAAFLIAPTPVEDSQVAPTAVGTPPVSTTPVGPGLAAPELLVAAASVVEQFDLAVADAAATGSVRADAAVDLRTAVDQLRLVVADGTTTEHLRGQVGQLRTRLADHRQAGAVDIDVAISLDLMLAALVARAGD